jgi:ketosteroid isomerase-like protein
MNTEHVLTPIEQEREAVVTGDVRRYHAALTDDAIFLPPNTPAKTGAELRSWLGAFVEGFRVEWLSFVSSEVEVLGDVAYHTYEYRWRVMPVAGGETTVGSGKGLHILRKQADGSWKIAREIWNSSPEP